VLDEIDERLQVALAEPRLVALIARAAESNWRASAWLLERKYPRWALGSQPAKEPAPGSSVFAEIDELAAKRRLKG
jgi:hypothetical protein